MRRGIVLASKGGGGVLSGEELIVEVKNGTLDLIRGLMPISIVILDRSNFVPPPSINGEGVEESGIGISLSKPVNSGFYHPKLLSILKNITKVGLERRF